MLNENKKRPLLTTLRTHHPHIETPLIKPATNTKVCLKVVASVIVRQNKKILIEQLITREDVPISSNANYLLSDPEVAAQSLGKFHACNVYRCVEYVVASVEYIVFVHPN